MGIKRVFNADQEVTIGAAIRAARLAAGMTQANLANALGISYQQVQNYERGSVRIAASTLGAIARLLDTPVSDFFDTRPRGTAPGAGLDDEQRGPAP